MGTVRNPAVAGSFYPAASEQLAAELRGYLGAVPPWTGPIPKAIIAPHAGYVYSGPIAASVYARLFPARGKISRVVLIGPSHRVAFQGIAASSAEAWASPFGQTALDRDAIARILDIPGVAVLDAAHAQEHSLEVHLPFLQGILGAFQLVPLVVGDATPELVATVLDALWGGPETLVVISSDLSHYLPQDAARTLDGQTCRAIESLEPADIAWEQACGRLPIAGLLTLARQRDLKVETVDIRNSGDTAGSADRVVGYGAWAFTEAEAEDPLRRHATVLRDIARRNIESMLRHGVPAATPDPLPEELSQPGASFVTLKRDGALRGCIGSPTAWRPLVEDVGDNAIRAAFKDPRFPPLSEAELDDLTLSVSVLTPPTAMTIADEADLLRQLRPRIDGLIIEDGGHRALFLPSVWEVLPDAREFLEQLRRKAGMPAGHWSPTFRAQRFQAVEM